MALQDRVVLITGGTGALGRVVSQRFLDAGCTVVTTYLDTDEFETVRDQLAADRFSGYKVDVTVDEHVESLVEKVLDEHGRIDVLLNLVGAWKGGHPIHETTEETWDSMLDINLKSAFLVSRHVLPQMRKQGFGRIVSVGSKTGHDLPAEGGPYAIAKHGVEALTMVLAKEHADHNITANCVLPSVIDTPANRESMGAENVDKWVQPEEIADRLLELVTDPDRNGERVKIYGGYEE